MKRILVFLCALLSLNAYSQCSVNPTVSASVINCDDSVIITLSGFADFALNNDFNSGVPGTDWTVTSSAQFNNPYIPSLTNDTYLWMGPNADVPRELTSLPLNLTYGGVICFDMVYAVQGNGSPVEGPDLPEEGVSLQYSIDGGVTWIDIAYFCPNGISGPNGDGIMVSNPGTGSGFPGANGATNFTTWDTYCFPIPAGAQTANTQVQWSQIFSSTAPFDHWGLDNIQIQVADPSYTFYNGNTGTAIDTNYTVVYPIADSTVVILYTNGIDDTCTADVFIEVNPTDAGPDLFACEGVGHQLNTSGLSPWSVVSWSPAFGLNNTSIPNPYANPSVPPQSQTYTVSSNCGSDDITIFLVDSFDISINQPDTICIGGSIQLTATASPTEPIATYEWGPAFMLNNTTSQTVLATPAITSDIYVTATSVAGCVRRDTVRAYVDIYTLDLNILPTNPLICLGDSVNLTAEVIPPSFPYIVAQVPFSTISPTGATNNLAFSSGNSNIGLSLGFNFNFFGANYSTATVGSNGFLSFVSTTTTYNANATIPATGAPNNLIAFLWDNLNIGAGGSAQYYTQGTAPNRVFVIDFVNVPFNTTNTGTASVQLVLFEATGVIQINNININNLSGSTITQGIENNTGSLGLAIPGHNNTGFSESNASYQFIPVLAPTNVTYSWSPNYNITSLTGSTTTVYPTSDFTYELTGTASSCVSSAQREVIIDIYDVVATPAIDTICPGEALQLNAAVQGGTVSCLADYFAYQIPYYKEYGSTNPIVFTNYDNGVSQSIPLPFPFQYYCQIQSQVRLSSNGYLSFINTGISISANAAIPNAGLPQSIVALLWDDLVDSANVCGYFTTGTAPNRKFVIDINLLHKGGTQASEPVIGQIILHEGTNVIDVICESCAQDADDPTATQGIENPSGNAGIATPGRNNAAWTANSNAWRFYPQSTLNTTYTINWSPTTAMTGANTQAPLVNPTTPTQYTVGITNSNNCTYYDTVQVKIANDLSVVATPDVSICLGDSVQLGVSTSGNVFTWTPNDGSLSSTTIANPFASPTSTTTYYINASLSTCVGNDSVTVSVSDFNVDSTALVDEICVLNSGSITVYTSGQNSGLSYSLNGGTPQSSNVFANLSGGSYTVLVSGGSGCDTSYTVALIGGAALMNIDSVVSTNAICGVLGTIDVYVTGGSAPISFSLNTASPVSSGSFNNLVGGSYTVVVEDAFACQLDTTIIITETNSLGVNFDNITNVSCYRNADGAVSFSANGGQGPFNYSIDGTNFVASNTFSSLDTGSYVAYITDANLCLDSAVFNITEPFELAVQIVAPGNVLCAGGTIDSLIAIASGGTTAYSYLWSTNATTPFVQGISFGTYWVELTDANACTTSDTVVIAQPIPLYLEISADSALCGGQNTGSAQVDSLSGGVLPYTYSWVGPNGAVAGNTLAANLFAGSYTLTVTDANACAISASVLVEEPSPVLVNLVADTLSCFGDVDACINATISGGVSPYLTTWNNAAITEDICSLGAGWYSLVTEDAEGCIRTDSVEVVSPTALSLVIDSADVTCKGLNNGSATISVTGGTTNYSYTWDDLSNQNTATAVNLFAGTYQVIVQDANGCLDTMSTEVKEPLDSLTLSLDNVIDALCFGNNGNINVSTNGGTPTYSYSWLNASNVQVAATEDLVFGAGTYTLTVTDANLCTASLTDTIAEPLALSLVLTPANISCNGANDGSITSLVNGGTTPYTHSWSSGQTTAAISGLSAGTYCDTVTDNNSCQIVICSAIVEPSDIVLVTDSSDVSCKDLADGTAMVTASGGTPGYTYIWSHNALETGAAVGSLSPGTYQVLVTDASGCQDSISTSISEPDSLLLSVDNVVDVLCNGNATGSISISTTGGTPTYTYSWTNGGGNNEDLNNVVAGNYTLTVSDVNACTYSINQIINEPTALAISLVGTNISCFGANTGSIDATVSGGNGPYSYAWSNSALTEDLSNLSAGTYTLTVTDANSCTLSQSILLTQPATVIIAFNMIPVSCFGGSNGSLTASIQSGGTAPFSYLWDANAANQNTASATNLIAGNYSVEVTDDNGCVYTNSASVTQPNTPLSLSIDSTDITCAGYDNGIASVSALGGTPGYTYLWNDASAQTTANATNLAPGLYTVVVADANNCTETASIIVVEPDSMTVIALADSANCWGDATGSISVSATGGTMIGYLYSIDGGLTFQSDSIFYNLDAGNYNQIIVQDVGSPDECYSQPVTAFVDQPAYFELNISPADTTLQLEESAELSLVYGAFYDSSDVVQVSWYPYIGLNCSDCLNPTVLTYENYTEYTATVYYLGDDQELCNQISSTVIIVENNLELFIPNAFTPNGSGNMNDVFEIYGEGIEFSLMQIYNRWGEKIYESQQQNVAWDGTYKGELQNPGVYTYYVSVQYLDGKQVERKGSVTLLR